MGDTRGGKYDRTGGPMNRLFILFFYVSFCVSMWFQNQPLVSKLSTAHLVPQEDSLPPWMEDELLGEIFLD